MRGSACQARVCVEVVAPAPTLSPTGLLGALAMLLASGGLALHRRRTAASKREARN